MCGTPGTVFAWFGAIFINISFGFLIAWGITTQWLIGLSLSFVYSCILFFVSFKLSKHVIIENSTVPEVLNANEVEQSNQGSSSESTKQGLRTLVVLLYTLAVISIGVTGLIIPMNIFYCNSYSHPWGYNNYEWKTNISSLPNDVQTWYDKIINGSIDHSYNDFATLPNSNVLLFSGNNDTGDKVLYKYDDTSITPYAFKNPYDFVLSLDNESICMAGYYEETSDNNMYPTSSSTIACYDKNNDRLRYITYFNTSNEYKDFYNPSYLYPSTNNTLWFIASSNNDYYYTSPPVFSLNDQSMASTLHSTSLQLNGKIGVSDNCDEYKLTRSRAVVSIFTSIIPTFIVAIVLHKIMKFIPTMSIIVYTCITTFIISLILSIQPMFTKIDLVLKIWLCSSSGIWLNYLVVVFLLDTIAIEIDGAQKTKTSHFVWNINFATLVFFFSMAWSLGIPVPYYDTWWRWIAINITVYIPYIFSGIIIETILLVLLGAIGIFENVWRFSNLIANQINDPSFQIVLQVVLFAIIGLFIGLFGWKVNQYQRDIQVCVRGWISRYFGFFIRKRDGEEAVLQSDVQNASTDDNDGVHTAVSIL